MNEAKKDLLETQVYENLLQKNFNTCVDKKPLINSNTCKVFYNLMSNELDFLNALN